MSIDGRYFGKRPASECPCNVATNAQWAGKAPWMLLDHPRGSKKRQIIGRPSATGRHQNVIMRAEYD